MRTLPNPSLCSPPGRTGSCQPAPEITAGVTQYMVEELEQEYAVLRDKVRELREYL